MEQKHSIPAPTSRKSVVLAVISVGALIAYMLEVSGRQLDIVDIATRYGLGKLETFVDRADARDCIMVNLYDAVEDLLDPQLDAELDAHLAALGF
jgi:hypothetical protein